MNNEKEVFEISLLISRFLLGEILPDELKRLEEWKTESGHHAALFDRICSEQRRTGKIKQYRESDPEEALDAFLEAKHRLEKRFGENKSRYLTERILPWVVNVAAVAVIVTGVWWLWQSAGTTRNRSEVMVAEQGDSAAHTVKLIAASGRIFGLDTVVNIEGEFASARNEEGRLVFSAKENETETIVYNTIEVPQGAEYELTLTDGTVVFLNSETIFRFPENFSETGARSVYLSGEAYFKVAKDSVKPFVVHTDHIYTKVLGTSFNVKAYANSDLCQTTLVNGLVRVGISGGGKELELQPGMQASYDRATRRMEKKKVDVSYYTAWKEGVFAFREARFEEVMEILSRWYGVYFFFQNSEARNYVYTGKIDRHGSLKEVLDKFKMTEELDFEIKNKTVTIKTRK